VAELTTEQVFDGSPDEVFRGIHCYEKYPEYLPGVTGIKVLPAKVKGSVAQVRYELKLVKSFHYTLNMFEENPNRIWWTLDDSNIMKHNNGGWTLTPAGGEVGKTKAVYALDVGFSGFVPQKIVDQITKANLPAMMKGFQKLIVDQRGK
jgi:ribosome-associated toxin RatA of RatAB toxin-antitoxin module